MDKDEQIRKGLKRLTTTPEGMFIATVTSVDKGNDVIDIEDLEGLDYSDVRLKSVIDGKVDVVKYPAVGSSVIVGSIGNDENTLFVLGYSEVESIEGAIGTSKFEIDKTGFHIERNGESLIEVLNDQIAELGKLCDEINKIVVLPSFGTTVNIPAVTLIRTKITTTIKQRFNNILT